MTYHDANLHVDQASVEDLDRLIDLSLEWERSIARRQIMARRQTMNLTFLRDNLLELGKVAWRGAA